MARIGIDARLTHYTQGGIAQYTQHIIDELGRIDSRNDYLILHSRKDPRNLAAAPNQRRIACWTPAHHRFERWALAAEVTSHRLDLLHSPDFIPPCCGRFKRVITVHDLSFLHYPQFLTADARRYYNGQIAWAVEHADHILADSEATRTDVIEMLGVPPARITTVPAAVSAHFRPVPPDEARAVVQPYGLEPGYILFLGTYEPRKNIGGLLRAYAALLTDLPDVPPLVLVGRRGWLYDDMFALAEALGLGERVRWVEDAEYRDFPAIYSAAAVLCMPSFYEGFGLPPLEAMACGTPVVVADRASLPEVVGEAGLMVEPESVESIADALRRVLTDPALAADLRERGLAQAVRFSWEHTARGVLAVYEQVLGSA